MNLVTKLYNVCKGNNLTIATAESCTSGLISSTICSISGASSIFKGGIIAYQDIIKINQLGIPKALIEKETSVCIEVAKKMAENSLKIFKSDYSISSTGYTGPNGGNNKYPIGTVFIAISNKKETYVKHFFLTGSRESVVNQVVQNAIQLLIIQIKKNQ